MTECITFVVVGATGDLARRRLLPALYSLLKHGKMPQQWFIMGVALETIEPSEILAGAREFVEEFDEQTWQKFIDHFWYKKTDFSVQNNVEELAALITDLEQKKFNQVGNRIIYMAIPPQFFVPVTQAFANNGIIKRIDKNSAQNPWCRVVYEKPFGQDRVSAHEMNVLISNYLDESQIFRVDHYLAKDIVGTLALVRFTNRVFEPLWNSENIEWVEIALRETVCVDGRGAYYDKYGALKDVVQNHLMQIVALLAMEAPCSLSGDSIRDQTTCILQKIRPVDGILAQYEGYHHDKGIKPDSTTETFAAVKLLIDTPRWENVPFYVSTGKCLTKKETVITIQFKPVVCLLSSSCPSEANKLTIRVLPEPGFSLELNVKKPGMLVEVMPVSMDFCYECRFGSVKGNTYELVLQEVMAGEQSISVRFDEIEYAWDIIEKIKALHLPLYQYEKGTNGPEELKDFAHKNGMRWQS
jgi:glucose-6-phosphate 1-dehydrogenase